MIRRRRVAVAGATLGLLLLPALLGAVPLRAQTTEQTFTPPDECSEPPPAELLWNAAAPVGDAVNVQPCAPLLKSHTLPKLPWYGSVAATRQ